LNEGAVWIEENCGNELLFDFMVQWRKRSTAA